MEMVKIPYLTASVHRKEICTSPYMQTKLEEGMLPQREFSLSRHFVVKELAVLMDGTPGSLARILLKADRSLGESLATFSGVVLLRGHVFLSAAACQRRFYAFKCALLASRSDVRANILPQTPFPLQINARQRIVCQIQIDLQISKYIKEIFNIEYSSP